jgi:hypothetical protein
MELSDSSLHYLKNYFLLEQTRNEANQFLQTIATGLARQVEVRLDAKDYGILGFERPWVIKDGGESGILLRVREGISGREDMADWKYYVQYNDAIRPCDLADSTHCLIWGSTPKANSAQIRRVAEAADSLGLPSPYRDEEVALLDAPSDEVIDKLADVFVGFCDAYAQVIRALLDEPQS